MKQESRLVGALLVGILLVLAVGIGVIATPKESIQTTVAYVDSAQILAKHPEMVKAAERHKARMLALQAELDAKAKTTDKSGQEKLLAEYQQKLDAQEQSAQAEAVKKINVQIRDVARKLGYSLVLDSRAVVFGGTDITAPVLKAAGVTK